MANLKYDDWENYLNKKLKCKKGDHEFDGILVGLADSVVAISPDKAVQPWRIVSQDGTAYDVYPEDNWDIDILD